MNMDEVRRDSSAYLVTVEKDALFSKPLDGALEDLALDVSADLGEVLGTEAVVDALDVLLDCDIAFDQGRFSAALEADTH